jgi:hypothetical protein
MKYPFTLLAARCVMIGVALSSSPLAAHQETKPSTASVAGDWSLSIHGDHVRQTGLALRQEGTKVTGTYHTQGKVAPVEGEFAEGKLLLAIDVAAISPDHAKKANTTKVTITATMKDDGTLEGEMRRGSEPIRITAERFRSRGQASEAQRPRSRAAVHSTFSCRARDAGWRAQPAFLAEELLRLGDQVGEHG